MSDINSKDCDSDDDMLDMDDTKALVKSDSQFDFNPTISRQVQLRRFGITAALIGLLIVGIAVRHSQPAPTICFPLPEVGNWTDRCDGFTSLLAGASCVPDCASGFVSNGRIECSPDGLVSKHNASCLPKS